MNNYEKMKKLYDEIDELLKNQQMTKSPDFQAWQKGCLRLIFNQFGEESIEYKNFKKIHYVPLVLYGEDDNYYEPYQEGLKTARVVLEDYLKSMEETFNREKKNNSIASNKKVFIVHGHDNAIKEETARVLERQSIEPIILHEQVNNSRTIIEKIEHYGNDVGAAIVLLTPDDTGKEKGKAQSKLNSRARQNVILEAGYFMGLLGRNHVIFICTDPSMEIPSDLHGVLYVNQEWKMSMLKELKVLGFEIDLNKL